MPRLRTLKNYEQIRTDWDEQSSADIDQEIQTGCTDSSGQSWLSNASIVASMPDAKLTQAIAYHQHMLRVMLNEQLARAEGRRVARELHSHEGIRGANRAPRATREVKLGRLISSLESLGVPAQLIKEILK